MDALTFELLRFSIDHYYNSGDVKQSDVKTDQSKDNKNNVAQFAYMVVLKDDRGNYSINLYPARCPLLINEKATSQFIDSDLPNIHDLMSSVTIEGWPVNVKKLDMLLLAVQLMVTEAYF